MKKRSLKTKLLALSVVLCLVWKVWQPSGADRSPDPSPGPAASQPLSTSAPEESSAASCPESTSRISLAQVEKGNRAVSTRLVEKS